MPTNNQRDFLDPKVLARLMALPLHARTAMLGNVSGKHRSPVRGSSLEFAQYRKYVPGDDTRRLDWRTWGRSDRFYIKEFEADTNLRLCLLLDTSGSMGIWEKYMARSFFFWMTRFLRTKYETVEIEFIAHHTEAKVVSEEDFFSKGESGGTICSSAYRKALELINQKYDPSRYNIYPFHFSDGDNLTSDNARCVKLVNELMKVSNMFGYGEVNQYNRHSTLMSAYKNIQDESFRHFILKQKSDVFHAMKSFFRKETEDQKYA